jgi:magnesium-transporting ATPase (P-type)
MAVARTAAINTLVTFEAFYLLNTRFLLAVSWPQRALAGNPYVPLAIAVVIGLQLLFTYAPFAQKLFHTAALGADAWLRIVVIALSIYIIVEVEKWLVRASRLRVG